MENPNSGSRPRSNTVETVIDVELADQQTSLPVVQNGNIISASDSVTETNNRFSNTLTRTDDNVIGRNGPRAAISPTSVTASLSNIPSNGRN